MRTVALVLALACAGHGRRIQPLAQLMQSVSSEPHESPKETFARLLTASQLAGGFNPAGGSMQGVRHAVNGSPARPVAMQEAALYEPATRDLQYGSNVAQYLVDLHDAKAPFNFCGGMMFQLVLTEKLREELLGVAKGGGEQPVIFDASKDRMAKIPDYSRSEKADNIKVFHGREIRQVPDAAGGMGFVLQLSSPNDDPEGWTSAEVAGYDGWGHDSGRTWRTGDRLESEGFKTFKSRFGEKAFTLHHRFYLHLDGSNQMWLSAEDGCEGHPASKTPWPFNMFGR